MTNTLASDGERKALASLLLLLERAEALARDGAARQAVSTALPRLSRALHAQARQEALHAEVCASVRGAIDNRRTLHCPGEAALTHYSRLIAADLAARDLPRSLIGLQIVFEGMGELISQRLRPSRIGTNPLLERAVKALAAQEAGHRRIGSRALAWSLARGHTQIERLREATLEYLDVADRLITDCADLFVLAQAGPVQYSALLRAQLPAWIEQRAP